MRYIFPYGYVWVKNASDFLSMGKGFKAFVERMKVYLSKLSMRTGILILLSCVPFYVLSFAQMKFPISPFWKSILFVVFFGLAKVTQYGGLIVIGAKGLKDLKTKLMERKQNKDS